jgi:hypothetical protein
MRLVDSHGGQDVSCIAAELSRRETSIDTLDSIGFTQSMNAAGVDQAQTVDRYTGRIPLLVSKPQR